MRKMIIVVRAYGRFIKRSQIKYSEGELGIMPKIQARWISLILLGSNKLDIQNYGNRRYYIIEIPDLIESIDFRKKDIWSILAGLVKMIIMRSEFIFH